ncbi:MULTISPECIES: fatty acyl-AMP ligase [Pseudoalteromonas]|uniref:Uncharacterized protein n=1 Tax=Pseudoalteromonas amylolytica TaxID=1859457 RepID=A0A1S1N090_9GAMM|nr:MULTISPECIES: fatty acyl-AMP ligase [Pseudoalteromonas]OHU90610.1 hypothetical protein BFC16_03120 [Pseudoalteromonas sp. JW3]OHU92769.1 hypothetical protein BET10_04775 [Pseudoalteromonas amylolytica]
MEILTDELDLQAYKPASDGLPNFVQILSTLALEKRDDTALLFLSDGETEQPPMTYGEFHTQAMKFAAGLDKQHITKGARVVLLYQSSYEFAVAFLGCLYAGVISIPLPVPSRRASDWEKIEKITNSAGAKWVITYEKAYDRIAQNAQRYLPQTQLHIVLHELLMQSAPKAPQNVSGSDIAFLQYTSGSTGLPKGVTLTHDNLIENQIILKKGFRNNGPSTYLSWLPLYHDMGLIGNFLQAIYIGQPFIFMAPNAFLQKPLRWLKAISKYKVRVSGAPNFAYELCVERISDEDKQTLDLSCWEVAFNGAEPVRAQTLKKFTQAFACCGFKASAFYPCYGTAESTLIISGATKTQAPVYLTVDRHSYECSKIEPVIGESADSITIVSSGVPLIEDSIAIVDGERQTKLPNMQVGEIWLHSPCNAIGYWDNEGATREAFQNRLADDDSGKCYLNTGDLGFTDGENLFITGRVKDLLIFNGRNIYPQDVELCSYNAHEALRNERCAAVSIYDNNKERLILIHEVERTHVKNADYDEVIESIRKAVYQEFAIPVYGIALVQPSTIPMTSSGKIRRQTCREQFMSGQLSLVTKWMLDRQGI